MIGIIIAGHGNFGTGIKSVINLVMGDQDDFAAVDFLESHSTEDLKNNLTKAMKSMDVEGYLFFTDIAGGSPFKKCVELSLERGNCEVLAGTNVSMIMEIMFSRSGNNPSELMEKAIEVGKSQILSFTMNKKKNEVEDTDGI